MAKAANMVTFTKIEALHSNVYRKLGEFRETPERSILSQAYSQLCGFEGATTIMYWTSV
jgi:hypothetical protein